MKKFLLFVGILVLIGLGALIAYRVKEKLTHKEEMKAQNVAPVTVALADVVKGELADIGNFTGTLEADSLFNISPKTAGRLKALPVLHLNDFPANPPRETIKDADRVFPGDGIAPLDKILQMVDRNGGTILSLELFNRNYWAMPALEACRAGLMKSVAAVAHALS